MTKEEKEKLAAEKAEAERLAAEEAEKEKAEEEKAKKKNPFVKLIKKTKKGQSIEMLAHEKDVEKLLKMPGISKK